MPSLDKKSYNYKESFSRYEFKYILKKSLSDRIEDEVKNFMKHDGFVHKELDNRYFVRSLYFDNKFFSNFYEKVDGMKIRKKYRLRTYGEIFDSKVPIFLEVKGRYQERSYKNRTIINHKDLDLFFAKKSGSKDIRKITDIQAVKRSVRNLVLLNHYEKPFHPEIGSGIRDLLFENMSPITAFVLAKKIEDVIENFEPRARLIGVKASPDLDRNAYEITIEFYVVNAPTELVDLTVFLERLR